MIKTDIRLNTGITCQLALLGLMLLAISPLAPGQNEENSSTENQEQTEEDIQALVEKLSVDERPVRQKAATKLITNQTTKAAKTVGRVLYSGSDLEKDALLTAIVGKTDDEQSINHLLEPLLGVYATKGNGENNALIEGISYFPNKIILDTILQLLRKSESVDGAKPSVSLLPKARLIRLIGKDQLSLDPVRVSERLFSLSGTLPDELYSELLVTLQQLYGFYSFTSFDEWKKWWEERQGNTKSEHYHVLMKRRASEELADWKKAIDLVFSLAENQEAQPDLKQLLQTNDPRKLTYILQKVQDSSDGNAVSLNSSLLISRLAERNPPGVLEELIKTAGKLGLTKAREKIESYIGHYRPSIRKASAAALGKIGNDESGERILKQFNIEENDAVLIAQLNAFKKLDYKDAIFKIHDRLIQSSRLSSSVQNEMVSTLGQMGERKSLPTLERLLSESKPEKDVKLRFNLALSIGQIGSPKGVPSLIKLTQAPSASVRGAAAQALGNISFDKEEQEDDEQQNDSLDALFVLLREAEDPTVKRRAAKSIAKIARSKTPGRLAKLIINRKNGVEEVVRKALVNSIKRFPGNLSTVVMILQEAGNHSLVTELDAAMEKEISNLDQEKRRSLQLKFVRSHLEVGNWSDAVTLLDKIEEGESSIQSSNIVLLRARANIGLGNFSKARMLLDSLEEKTEDSSTLHWKIRSVRAQLYYVKGPPERAITYITETLRPKSPPENINQRLKEIEQRHRKARQTMDENLSFLLSGTTGVEDKEVQKRVNQLQELEPYHPEIVRRILKKLKENSTNVGNVLNPALVNLLNSITGTSHSLEEPVDSKFIEEVVTDWTDWLEKQESETKPSSS